VYRFLSVPLGTRPVLQKFVLSVCHVHPLYIGSGAMQAKRAFISAMATCCNYFVFVPCIVSGLPQIFVGYFPPQPESFAEKQTDAIVVFAHGPCLRSYGDSHGACPHSHGNIVVDTGCNDDR
jgi:hypothetical protein